MKRFKIILLFALLILAGTIYAYSKAVPTVQQGDAAIEWAFTQADQHPEKLLISVIDSAQETLDIAIYSLTYPDIVAAIKKAAARGVSVRIITDQSQSKGKSQNEALKILGSAGIPIKVNTHSGLMHIKMTIVDGKVATTGSFNYSKAASTTNDEVLMVLRGKEVAQSFAAQFRAMWNDQKEFIAVDRYIAMPEEAAAPPGDVIFKSCTEVKKAGKAPIRLGDPGYSSKLDGDGDEIACEN
jgi:phosphatidylserine/phosphatidylglycerophosphate/cardiolipin synthase-like enzyme